MRITDKRLILGATFLLACGMSRADGTSEHADTYMAFESRTETVTLASAGLEMRFADGKLLAQNPTESLTLPLTDLQCVYFTDTHSGITILNNDGIVGFEAYKTDGTKIGRFSSVSELEHESGAGIYILSREGKSIKIRIK